MSAVFSKRYLVLLNTGVTQCTTPDPVSVSEPDGEETPHHRSVSVLWPHDKMSKHCSWIMYSPTHTFISNPNSIIKGL